MESQTETNNTPNDLVDAPSWWTRRVESYGSLVTLGVGTLGLGYYILFKKPKRFSAFNLASDLPKDYFKKDLKFTAKALEVFPPQEVKDLELLTLHMGGKFSIPRVAALFGPPSAMNKNDSKLLEGLYLGYIRVIVPNVSVSPEYMGLVLDSIAMRPNLSIVVMGQEDNPDETVIYATVGIQVKQFKVYRHQNLGLWILKNGYGYITPYNKKLAMICGNYESYHAKLMYAEGNAHGKKKGIWKNFDVQDPSKWALFTGLIKYFMSTMSQKKV